MWATLRLPPSVITRATPASGSYVTHTGTTCGVPSGRGVVRVERWLSRQNATYAGAGSCTSAMGAAYEAGPRVLVRAPGARSACAHRLEWNRLNFVHVD